MAATVPDISFLPSHSSPSPLPSLPRRKPFGRRISFPSLPKTLSTQQRSPAPSSTLSHPPEAEPEHIHSTNNSPEDQSLFSNTDSRPVSRATSHSTVSPSNIIRISAPSLHSSSDAAWRQAPVSKRISLGWNLTFSLLSPPPATQVQYQRVQPKQIAISKRSSASSSSTHRRSTSSGATSSVSTTSTDSSADDRPFSGNRYSLNNLEKSRASGSNIDSSLFTVEEESKVLALPSDFDRPFAARESFEAVFEEPTIDPIEQLSDDMGLARALTKRLQRSDSANSIIRLRTERKQRPQISLPLELLSTTNELAHYAPDLVSRERDGSAPSTPTSETPELTDNSSIGSRSSSDSPTRHFSFAEHNHLTQYFESAGNKTPPMVEVMPVSPSTPEQSPIPFGDSVTPPALPTRAASHSKREHVRLARARSIRSSGGFSSSSIGSRHASLESSPSDQPHPFGKELAQLDEVQEDFNSMIIEHEQDADDAWLASAGYRKFTPSAYCSVLADLEATRFDDY